MNSFSAHIIIATSLLLIYGCSSTKVYYEADKKYKPTRSVEILDSKPRKPYIVIATLEASAPKYDNGQFVFEKMRQKAQKIGAHAIVPIEFREIPEHTSVTVEPDYRPPEKPGRIDISKGVYLKQPKIWGKALAIRFPKPDKESD